MQIKIMVLNGPNLNFLGKREPHLYGTKSLVEIEAYTKEKLVNFGDIQLDWFQSNHEGELIEKLHHFILSDMYDALIINPAAYTHTSIGIYDALRMIKKLKLEVHLTNTFTREDFRQQKLTSKGCDIIMEGLGVDVYYIASLALQEKLKK